MLAFLPAGQAHERAADRGLDERQLVAVFLERLGLLKVRPEGFLDQRLAEFLALEGRLRLLQPPGDGSDTAQDDRRFAEAAS